MQEDNEAQLPSPVDLEVPLSPLDLACDHVQAAREQLHHVTTLISQNPLRSAVRDETERRLSFVDQSLEHVVNDLEAEAKRLGIRAALAGHFVRRPRRDDR